MGKEIKDVYFRRFFVPVIITLLVLAGIAVILGTPPGTPVNWSTFGTAMGDGVNTLMGGFRRLRS